MASGLRDDKRFMRWAIADGISVTGTAISNVVLPIVVYEATGSSAATGGLFALRVIPYLLFGAVAGPVADKWNRRRLILGGHIIEGVLVATIPIAALMGVLTVAQVYAVGLLSATAFVFSDAAVFGAVPALVGTERLAAANGFLGSMVSGAEILGPALGGLLAATIGATNAVWFDSASFFNAAGFGAVVGLLVPYAVEQLSLPEGNFRIGILYSVYGAGALISGLLFSRIFTTGRVRWITPATIAMSSCLAVGLVASTSWLPSAVILLLFSLSVSTTIVTGITYRQLAAPDDLRSSVNVFGRMISWGGQPFGAAAGALISALLDVRAAYMFTVIVTAVSALMAYVFLRPGTEIATTPRSS
jgi:MFS family permease